ncbi:endonuclease domain-containing protein [Corynebacterium sp. H130]|uniref:endonuclease domain-containing protein n=1 Tax=Corynebacterium sp. H130 TaxID=3133444 RepID=UPI0030979255
MNTFTFDSIPIPVSRGRAGFTRIDRGVHIPTGSPLSGVLWARCIWTKSPSVIFGGFVGLTYHYIHFWQDTLPIVGHVLGSKSFNRKLYLQWGRFSGQSIAGLDPCFRDLRVASLPDCVIDCLIQLKKHQVEWDVPPIPGLEPWQVRAVQVIDAARRHRQLTWAELKQAAKHRFCAKQLLALSTSSSDLCDSPRETLLRLLISDLAANPELQHPIFRNPGDEFPFTIIDLAWKDHKVAVYYDGEHHLDRRQRNRDAEIRNHLEELGWVVVAVTAPELRNPERLRRRVKRAIDRGR